MEAEGFGEAGPTEADVSLSLGTAEKQSFRLFSRFLVGIFIIIKIRIMLIIIHSTNKASYLNLFCGSLNLAESTWTYRSI